MFREGLAVLLEEHGHQIVGHAATGRDGVRVARETSPDLVVLDLGLPGEPGVEVVSELGALAPVLVMSGSDSDADVVGAMRAGASGYVVKDVPMEQVLAAAQAVAAGGIAVSPAAAAALVQRLRSDDAAPTGPPPLDLRLEERELSILRLLVDGCDNGDIARELNLSLGTVKADVSGLLDKLGAGNRVQLAVAAVRGGLV